MDKYAELLKKLAARIDNMIEHSEDENLREELFCAKKDLFYTPPECIADFGARISLLLIRYCGKEDAVWHRQVINDWTA